MNNHAPQGGINRLQTRQSAAVGHSCVTQMRDDKNMFEIPLAKLECRHCVMLELSFKHLIIVYVVYTKNSLDT